MALRRPPDLTIPEPGSTTAREVLSLANPRAVGRRALNLLGGFHHAKPDAGGGFCAVNDLAVAVAAVRAEGFAGRVLVLDLDAHPPDGTAACLAADPSAWIGSLSGSSWYKFSAISGKSIASLYGVSYLYGATKLFKTVTTPTASPTKAPTAAPTVAAPTAAPTPVPTVIPTTAPTAPPSAAPSPSPNPSASPDPGVSQHGPGDGADPGAHRVQAER